MDTNDSKRSPTHAYQENENVQVLPVIPELEQIDNLRDNDNGFEEVYGGYLVNDTNVVDETPFEDEMEGEELVEESEEEYDESDSTNDDVP
ncbi:hypothetical protein SESBI_12940 [Sesbania bispinosa]|nr:hypothetical protein SESBI_12940 [Sesbania bispinosa]